MQTVKLAYCPINNFGDELTPWLWSNLLPDYIDTDKDNCHPNKFTADIALVSLGSYLSPTYLSRFTPTNKVVIAGTGCGYKYVKVTYSFGLNFPYNSRAAFDLPFSKQQRYTDSKRIYWLRGSLSSHCLGLPKETAVADTAYLLRKIQPSNFPKRAGVAFMPHKNAAKLSNFEKICNQIGFTYIDPRESRTTVIEKIAKAEVLVTEAKLFMALL